MNGDFRMPEHVAREIVKRAGQIRRQQRQEQQANDAEDRRVRFEVTLHHDSDIA